MISIQENRPETLDEGISHIFSWKQQLHCTQIFVRWGKMTTYLFSTLDTKPLTAHLQSLCDSTLNQRHTCRSPGKTPFNLPILFTHVKKHEAQSATRQVLPSFCCPSLIQDKCAIFWYKWELQGLLFLLFVFWVIKVFVFCFFPMWKGAIGLLYVHDALCLVRVAIFPAVELMISLFCPLSF